VTGKRQKKKENNGSADSEERLLQEVWLQETKAATLR
jgi:hypothetical protein